jgi:hypothetical protein
MVPASTGWAVMKKTVAARLQRRDKNFNGFTVVFLYVSKFTFYQYLEGTILRGLN